MREANYGCRIEPYGTYKGMRTLVLQNELIRMSILLDKGSDIYELLYKPKDTDFMWRSPLGLRHPQTPASISNPRGVFMDHYHGGWQELFPAASGPTRYRGANLGMHGEVACCPWDFEVLVDQPEAIEVKLKVKTLRTPFVLEKRIRLESGSPVIHFDETVHNWGSTELDYMWGHHPSFGAPFLSRDCILDLPECGILSTEHYDENGRFAGEARSNWPYAAGAGGNKVDLRAIGYSDGPLTDMFYADSFAEGWYALTNPRRGIGFGMVWHAEHFPYLWIWRELGGTQDYPWYGGAYTVSVEPFTSRPSAGVDGLKEAIRNGTAARIGAGQTISKRLKAIIYESNSGVKKIEPSGEVVKR